MREKRRASARGGRKAGRAERRLGAVAAALALLATEVAGHARPATAAARPVEAVTAAVAIDPPAAAGALAPALVAVGEAWLATWLEPATPPTAGHRLRLARWQQGTWRDPVTVHEGEDFFANPADTPELVLAPDGSLLVAWLARSATGRYDYDIALARSTDGGASFASLGRLNDDRVAAEHGFVSFASDGRGVRAFWLDGRETPAGGAMSLRTAVIADGVVGASELVDPRVCDCCPTAAVTTGTGPLVVYRDRSEREVRDPWLARRSAGAAFVLRPVAAEGWRIEGCPVNGPALAAAGDEVWIAWFTGAEDRARVLWTHSTDGGATLAPASLLDGDEPVGRVALVTLGNAGSVAAWIAAAGDRGELRLARLGSSGRAGAPRAVAVVSLGRTSGRPRLARAGEQIAVIWTEGERAGETRVRAVRLPAAALPAP